MVVDENPAVRAQAAFSIIEHAHHYPDDSERAYAVIRSALMPETGSALLDGLAQGLAAHPAEELITLENGLRTHTSGVIPSSVRRRRLARHWVCCKPVIPRSPAVQASAMPMSGHPEQGLGT